MADEKKIQEEVEAALRGGNPDDAARVLVAHKGISLDAARAEIFAMLKARQKR